MLKNVFNFEVSSVLSESAAVGGGVDTDGIETMELAVEGAGEARPIVDAEVEVEEADAMCGHLHAVRKEMPEG